jgi:general secretion pathway protein H
MPVNRGFTLIELLIVIVIVSITTTIALMAFDDFGASRQVFISAEQFVNYVKLVQQHAILEMTTFGITIDDNHYTTYRFQETGQWQVILKPRLLQRHAFAKKVVVIFSRKKANHSPDIIIDASGNMTAFKLDVCNAIKKNPTTIIGQANGNLAIHSHE